MSLNKETVIEEFNRIKEREITFFENSIKLREKYLNEHPERKVDFQIAINEDDELKIYSDNWCYQWIIDEYELH